MEGERTLSLPFVSLMGEELLHSASFLFSLSSSVFDAWDLRPSIPIFLPDCPYPGLSQQVLLADI